MSNTNIKNRVITGKLPCYMLARFTIHTYIHTRVNGMYTRLKIAVSAYLAFV